MSQGKRSHCSRLIKGSKQMHMGSHQRQVASLLFTHGRIYFLESAGVPVSKREARRKTEHLSQGV